MVERISIARFARKASKYVLQGLPIGLTKHGKVMAWIIDSEVAWYECEGCGENTVNSIKFRSSYSKRVWEKIRLCDECGEFLKRRGVKMGKFSEGLKNKIERYRESKALRYDYNRKVILAECSEIQKKLKIRSIKKREYILLRSLREALEGGSRIDVVEMAIKAGYPERKTRELGSGIMRSIPDKLFDEVVGVSRKDIKLELSKVIKQDEDLAAKNRALELAAKITGMAEADGAVKLQINQAFEVAD